MKSCLKSSSRSGLKRSRYKGGTVESRRVEEKPAPIPYSVVVKTFASEAEVPLAAKSERRLESSKVPRNLVFLTFCFSPNLKDSSMKKTTFQRLYCTYIFIKFSHPANSSRLNYLIFLTSAGVCEDGRPRPRMLRPCQPRQV